MRFINARLAIIFFLLVLDSASSRADDAAQLRALGPYIVEAMETWEVPGLAISVVKDGKQIFSKGYGIRKVGEDGLVNSDTLFAIGSASKAFTASSLGILADEGRLSLDDKVTEYLPDFELYDPYASRELTVRDLLCHRSGLSRGDALWYGTTYTRGEILRRVRYLKPSWSFRSAFGYQNLMFLAAGQIIPAVTGQSWSDFVRERIFDPLGMKNSHTSVNDILGLSNVAQPHNKIDETVQPIPHRNIDNVAPAGAIYSSAEQMSRWLLLHLAEGRIDDDVVLSEGFVKEMQTPQTLLRYEGRFAEYSPKAHFLAYGLGWFLHDYEGRLVVDHGGAIDGMRTHVAFLPEDEIGVVLLSNMDGSILPVALSYTIFDALLGLPDGDWSSVMFDAIDKLAEPGRQREAEFIAARQEGTKPSVEIDEYVGRYRSELYGDSTVELDGGHLVYRFGPSFVGDLEHWHHDTFKVTWRDPVLGKSYVTFSLDGKGEVAEISSGRLGDSKRVD